MKRLPIFMPSDDFDRALHATLAQRRQVNQLRHRVEIHSVDSTHLRIGDSQYVNFASNNYLGLTHHPRIREAIESSLAHGAGSGAAGLISGYSDVHRSAELAIAKWKAVQACVLLPSGYQANLAAIQTLASLECAGGVRFLLDKLVHASLLDAVRATGSRFRIFPHNHLAKLRRLLEESPAGQMQVVVTESIFSMDGDAADLHGIAAIKKDLPFVLMLDEAHASGVYGLAGAGYATEAGLQNIVDVSVITLSKALGTVGGAVCASAAFCDALINVGRAYIYSTSIPPMIAAASQAAVEVCQAEPHRQQRVRSLARHVRGEFARAKVQVAPGDSPIIPIIIGDETQALSAANALKDQGMWVVAVRPPTVPRGSSRLRVTLSCDHTDAAVQGMIEAVIRIRRKLMTSR